MATNIEWTDITDNIIRVKSGGWWCEKISPGCANCYAEKLNKNTFFGGNKKSYSGQAPELKLDTETIRKWAFQKKSYKHFVASMTDVFGDWVPSSWQREILDSMKAAPLQTFQILTKRPQIMSSCVNEWLAGHGLDKLPSNIWVGTSIENRQVLEQRSLALANIPANIHFWSVEPLLEDLGDISQYLNQTQWIIIGAESGPNSRRSKKHYPIPPLPPLLWLCDRYGISLSTDGRSPIGNALWKSGWQKAGATFGYWRHNLAWVKAELATLRDSEQYQAPPGYPESVTITLSATPEKFLEKGFKTKQIVSQGTLYQYLENKKLHDGSTVHYPYVIGERDRQNPSHWRWGFNWKEKFDGVWKSRSIGSIPSNAVSTIQAMQRLGTTREDIIAFIKQSKTKSKYNSHDKD